MFLKDIWSVIIKHTNLYDTIFLRASSKWLNKLCKEYRPFPKYHVLDQDECMTYLIEIGSISCLDYVKNILHYEWTSKQSIAAIGCGQVDVLKHLRANGCPFNPQTALIECTKASCLLDMIKYLLESGSSWQEPPYSYSHEVFDDFISNMATHGHINCIKYAIQTGCTNKAVYYTPSMECLEFLLQHQFVFHTEDKKYLGRRSVCEYAAIHGDLTMMKYAHQNELPISNMCAHQAARKGYLDCLKYALENIDDKEYVPSAISTIECFKYVLEKFGRDVLEPKLDWRAIGQTNVEYLQYIINSGISLPRSGQKFHLLLGSAFCSSSEVLHFIIDRMPSEEFIKECARSRLHNLCVRQRNVKGLKLLFKWNIPSTQGNIDRTVCVGDLDLLKYVWEKFHNKEQFDIQQSLLDIDYITPEIIDFLVEHGAKLTSQHLQQAACNGNLQITAHLIHLGCKYLFAVD